jgi:hypothetical protein
MLSRVLFCVLNLSTQIENHKVNDNEMLTHACIPKISYVHIGDRGLRTTQENPMKI